MKVYISGYRDHWISPYTILNHVFFWTNWSKCGRSKDFIPDHLYVSHPDWVETWADKLEPISYALKWILDIVHPQVRIVKIDYYDTWSMDHTLAHIVLPMLKQLKETKMGSGYVDDEDVPEELQGSDENLVHDRWDYVLGEMIFSFESKLNDEQENIFHDHSAVDKDADLTVQITQMKTDHAGLQDYQKRVTNGFRLFGKYYQGLWD